MYKASEGWNDHLFQVPPELLEKFAELIVRECARVADTVEAWDIAPSGVIEKHFGVEE
jgi:hypothetical protein